MTVSLPPPPPRRTTLKADETRELILQAAEARFASKGFYPTRLEDIADDVGITRTAVIYHFHDKETLYNAVLEKLFTQLNARINATLDTNEALLIRIEAAVTAWVLYAGEHPTLMRLFMREVAGSEGGLRLEVSRYVAPMFSRLVGVLSEAQAAGLCRAIDPVQFWSILAGATMFFIMDAPLLAQDSNMAADLRVQAYASELTRVIHGLLDIEKAQRL